MRRSVNLGFSKKAINQEKDTMEDYGEGRLFVLPAGPLQAALLMASRVKSQSNIFKAFPRCRSPDQCRQSKLPAKASHNYAARLWRRPGRSFLLPEELLKESRKGVTFIAMPGYSCKPLDADSVSVLEKVMAFHDGEILQEEGISCSWLSFADQTPILSF
ncbi:Hypothetical protein NTJ_14706 [Nesidiocoris tenuis]|uniref:Uncharacterized protein n=1 Tax=Nesidiocoris tenuis TaxID=355587 RepID=A0ABN7BC26_9HEMI|nr:Hypothetical protein NTJ_14706 [Nesidiocoris tenuis]